MVSRKSNTPEVTPETSTDMILSDDDLRSIHTIEDALNLFERNSVTVANAKEEIGDGFAYTDDKDALIGRPLLLVKWDSSNSSSYTDENGEPLDNVQVWAITEINGTVHKLRFVDFSTGICRQLKELTERTGRTMGLAVPRGLRRSDFEYTDPITGRTSPASTYYLDIDA